MSFIIPDQIVQASHRSETEMRLDLAVFFYTQWKMSLGKCAEFAGISRFHFQKELAKRDLTLNIAPEDIERDVATLEKLSV
ncbi:MAG: UPF0175 family protein [Saprospiraceae bacterium]|nr:UPF0175 family protein [Saprospiraceae bacterium]